MHKIADLLEKLLRRTGEKDELKSKEMLKKTRTTVITLTVNPQY